MEEFDDDTTSIIPTDLDLGHNDNSFHVLASLLVEFFSDRYTSNTIVLLPEDRFALDRLLPSTAVHSFIAAVQYRLGTTTHTPPAAPTTTTPLAFLTLKCQQLGLDQTDATRNPILVAATLDREPKTVLVRLDGDDKQADKYDAGQLQHDNDDDEEEYVMDMQPPSSSSSSSSPSVIHVASSQDVADAMHQEAEQAASILDRARPPVLLLAEDDDKNTQEEENDEEDVVMEDPATIAAVPGHYHHPAAEASIDRAAQQVHPPPLVDSQQQSSVPPPQHAVNTAKQVPEDAPPPPPAAPRIRPTPNVTQTAAVPPQQQQQPMEDDTQPATAPAETSSIMGQFQASAGGFFQDFFSGGGPHNSVTAAAGAKTTTIRIPPTDDDTTAQNTSAAVAASTIVDPSTNTNRAVVANTAAAHKEEEEEEAVNTISPVVPANPNPPMNPFLMNFASFMDRTTPAPPPSAAAAAVRQPPPHPKRSKPEAASAVPPKDPSKHVDLQSLPAKPSIRSDQTAREQLEDELAEAEQMLGMSVTPETTNFWRNHRNLLASRLATLGPTTVPETTTTTSLAPVPSSGSGNDNNKQHDYLSDSTRALPDTIPAATGGGEASHHHHHPGGSKTFSEITPTPPITAMPQPNHLASTGTGSIKETLPMVDVVAPADLPGGYQFEAEIEGKRFLAVVPAGGVQQGETFTCYMRELDSVAVDIPVGYWKDGLHDMCRLGCCHPVFWHSFMCPLIALGQIQTRIDLDFLGRPRFGTTTVSNRFMMLTLVLFWVFTNIGLFIACNLKWSHGMELSVADICAFLLMNGTMLAFLVFVTQSTRNSLREKFMIREERCLDLEDLCCALACLPCTVGQMARHTANYEEYEAVCCSHTGLPDGVCVNQSEEATTTPYNKTDGYVV